jgi:D-alanyl-lipoteichoic acid acyltransferase DltB (MBOAT superfamily)
MLFNSSSFLFGFLPVVLAGFILLSNLRQQRLAGVWLTAASLFFYGWWNPLYLPLLVGSMVFNYVLGGYLLKKPSRALLAIGIAANLALLGYYKYAGFLVQSIDQLTGLDWAIPNIVLPLAISFFTFQQIAYLVDAHGGAVVEHDFLNYCLFITFFPHLIAGPITHHREMFPQFNDPAIFRPKMENFAVGLTLFLIGLAKKVAIADTMGNFARPIYAAAADGVPISFLEAWSGAISYSLQVYFDFSGYTDMAIGLGLMFGISLPPNFDSPLKARNIIEFWSRWHMTLTRFVTAYIYNPIVVRMTRRRAGKGLPLPKRGTMPAGAFAGLVAFPTILAMFIIGVWHGAGWQFVIFGLIHGAYLTINHGWRAIKTRLGMPLDSQRPLTVAASVLFTFVCVVMALVFFRADNVPAALNLLAGMVGEHGFVMPERLVALPVLSDLRAMFDLPVADLEHFGFSVTVWIVALLAVVWTMPNSQQLMRHYRTALAAQPKPSWLQTVVPVVVWHPGTLIGLTIGWLGFFLVIRAISAAPTEFLYFQF